MTQKYRIAIALILVVLFLTCYYLTRNTAWETIFFWLVAGLFGYVGAEIGSRR